MFDELYMNVANQYDTFLQECFKSYGITEENISEYKDRITIDRLSPVATLDGSVIFTHDEFFLDGQPIFSVKQVIRYEETTPGVYKASIRFEKGGTS